MNWVTSEMVRDSILEANEKSINYLCMLQFAGKYNILCVFDMTQKKRMRRIKNVNEI